MCFANLRQEVQGHVCPLGGSGCLELGAAKEAAELTADVLLYPSEGDASFFAAFTES